MKVKLLKSTKNREKKNNFLFIEFKAEDYSSAFFFTERGMYMDKLWSPWRSQYIESFKNENKSDKCVFCDQENTDITDPGNLVVFKDRLTFVVLNLYPYNSGHLMVVPHRHTSDFQSLSMEENTEIMRNLQLTTRALGVAMQPHGFNVGANIGKAAGAGIDTHIHFHVVPRWNGDINFMPAIGEVKVISEDLLATKNKLVSAFRELIKQ